MSDELDWELGELFDSGLFPFPVYELSAARRVVRYLMKRGISDEELASAIQGSTLDLHAWLNHRSRGRRMFGEWTLAWLNESREAHRCLSLPRRSRRPVAHSYGSFNDSDSMSRDDSSSRDSSDSDDSDDDSDFLWSKQEAEVDRLSSSSSSSSSTVSGGFSGGSGEFFTSARRLRGGGGDDVTASTSVRSYDVTTKSALGGSSCLRHVIRGNLNDSGNISDLSSAKSKNSFRKNIDDPKTKKDDVTDCVDRDVTRDGRGDVGRAARDAGNCSCRLTHYISLCKMAPNE